MKPSHFWVALFLMTCCAAYDSYPKNSDALGPNISHYAVSNLPDVNYSLPQSWAGQIAIPGTRDDSLFFWLFEAESHAQRNNLIIWLEGGPGCTSLAALAGENGPLAFYGNATKPAPNQYSWTKLANILYIDQPVGTGFSSGSSEAVNNTQVTEEFYAWLTAFYAQFSGLISMKTYLMGESYAGVYIPYFTQAILSHSNNLSINIQSITMGDPTIGNYAAMIDVPIAEYMYQHNSTLDVPDDIQSIFNIAASTCGFDQVLEQLTYPPSKTISILGYPEELNQQLAKRQASLICNELLTPTTAAQVNASIFNGCFGPCATWTTAQNYMNATRACWDEDNIAYTCATVPNLIPGTNYFNQPTVRSAIHAPDKDLTACNATVQVAFDIEDVVPPAFAIIPSLLEHGVKVHIYSGDYDFLLPHIGTELVIQNMTWAGKQGLQRPPSNPFIVNNKPVGNWGQNRGLSYHHISKAGHSVPHDRPAVAFAYVRDFVLSEVGYQTV